MNLKGIRRGEEANIKRLYTVRFNSYELLNVFNSLWQGIPSDIINSTTFSEKVCPQFWVLG